MPLSHPKHQPQRLVLHPTPHNPPPHRARPGNRPLNPHKRTGKSQEPHFSLVLYCKLRNGCVYVCIYIYIIKVSQLKKYAHTEKIEMKKIGRCNLHGRRGRVRKGVADGGRLGWGWRWRWRRRRARADGSGEANKEAEDEEGEGEKRRRSSRWERVR